MEILASILGGLVGGLFTFLGVLVTIKHDEKKRNEGEYTANKSNERFIEAFRG